MSQPLDRCGGRPELELLIADQQRDAQDYRARDVFDLRESSHRLLIEGDRGVAQVIGLRKRHHVFRHGTLYCYKRLRCRCSECRTANAEWQRAYRRSLPPRSGTAS